MRSDPLLGQQFSAECSCDLFPCLANNSADASLGKQFSGKFSCDLFPWLANNATVPLHGKQFSSEFFYDLIPSLCKRLCSPLAWDTIQRWISLRPVPLPCVQIQCWIIPVIWSPCLATYVALNYWRVGYLVPKFKMVLSWPRLRRGERNNCRKTSNFNGSCNVTFTFMMRH